MTELSYTGEFPKQLTSLYQEGYQEGYEQAKRDLLEVVENLSALKDTSTTGEGL